MVDPLEVVVASQNADKIAEIEEVLADLGIGVVRGHQWPEIAETEATLEGNALLKARAVMEATGLAAVADDTGLEVAALDGAPGVHTARYAGPDASYEANVAKLLDELEDVTDRSARFRSAIAFVTPEGSEIVVEGCLDGEIGYAPRGSGGFGYDPVFMVEGRSLAEMTPAVKNTISHRALALRALHDALSRTRRNPGG